MKKDRGPNVILINCDDVGYGDFGCYGSTLNKTPTVDRMAKEGMLFTDFYTPSSVCSPSRGGVMTGCYPARIDFLEFGGLGVLFPGQPYGLHCDETTIPQLLKERGYRTMIVGKWHCGDQPEFLPTARGFDKYFGLPYSNDMGRQIGGKEYPPLPLMKDGWVIQEQPDQTSLTERYVEHAVNFIHESKEEPFFLYFAHVHAHLPLYVAERFRRKSNNAAYGAAIEAIDWALDCVLTQLEKDDLLDNTLVILTSDNGARGDHGGSNGPLRGGKNTTWEGGLRVPCIMYWPGKIKPGSICNHIFTGMDLFPTIASLTGRPIGEDLVIDGMDFSEVLLDPNASAPRDSFFYYWRENLEAVRYKNWKYHVGKRRETMHALYNLEEDIGETTDVAEQHPEIVKQLVELMENCRIELGDGFTNVKGKGVRPKGKVDNPKPLTTYSPDHPYIMAMYDSYQRG